MDADRIYARVDPAPPTRRDEVTIAAAFRHKLVELGDLIPADARRWPL